MKNNKLKKEILEIIKDYQKINDNNLIIDILKNYYVKYHHYNVLAAEPYLQTRIEEIVNYLQEQNKRLKKD